MPSAKRHLPRIVKKIELFRKADISVYFGGTLFEAFVIRNQFKDYFQNETLVESMTNDLDSMDYSSKFKIDGVDIKISISKIS